MILRALWASLALVLGVGCGDSGADDNVVQISDNVVQVSSDDAAMKAAIESARSTVAIFQEALGSSSPTRTSFSLKLRFEEGEHVEHMWIGDVAFDGKLFTGFLSNEPEALEGVSIGDKATVSPASISDWMFIEDGKLVGGYTIRAVRDSLSPEEKKEFDNQAPFKIE